MHKIDQRLYDFFAEKMTTEDLPNESLQWVAAELGIEAALRLMLNFNGITIYVPTMAKRRLQRKYAKAQFDGHNARSLALQLGVSERTIYDWVRDVPNKHQLDLFEHPSNAE